MSDLIYHAIREQDYKKKNFLFVCNLYISNPKIDKEFKYDVINNFLKSYISNKEKYNFCEKCLDYCKDYVPYT